MLRKISLIEKIENDNLKSPGVKQKLINSSKDYKDLIEFTKRTTRIRFINEFGKDPPEEVMELNELVENLLKQFYEKFNNLDDAIKDDESALIKVMEKEMLKFKINEHILDPSFIKLNGHFLAVGEVDMNENRIKNLAPPVEDDDAITKAFLEDELKNVNAGDGGAAFSGDMKGRKLVNVGDPKNPEDGVNKKYVDTKTPFNKLNGYFIASSEFDMGIKKIKNLALPIDDTDAVNKMYVDESINNIDAAFLRRNGGFLAADSIDMNTNRITKVGDPQFSDDATNKNYVDNNFIKKERIYKFLGTSIILIRGEAEGPIIGMNEIENINRRRPTIDGRNVAIGDDGNPVFPSIVYFGKYDGGEIEYNNQGGSITVKPNYLIPYEGSVLSCSFTFIGEYVTTLAGDLKFVVRVDEETKLSYGENFEDVDYSKGLIKPFGTFKEHIITKRIGREILTNQHHLTRFCLSRPEIGDINFKNCASLILYFDTSYKRVKMVYITLAVQIHFSGYNEDYLPDGW